MTAIDAQGFYDAALQRPSSHCEPRPDTPPSLIVIHNISLPPFVYGGDTVPRFFCRGFDESETEPFLRSVAGLKVASHFMIDRAGTVYQFVSCRDMAYHAGLSSFRGRPRCNEFSIGIELEGCDFEPFAPAQYQALLPLLRAAIATYPIEAVCGHQDIAPARKTDPGHFFDWSYLQRNGIPVHRV